MNTPLNKTIVLGGGCFWCLDALYRRVRGVANVVSGMAGGHTKNPRYEDIHRGDTGHAEVVRIEYDQAAVTLETLLTIFWHIHDPTTLNRQGADVGTEYRSIILYQTEEEEAIIQKSLEEANQDLWDGKIVTEVKELGEFYPADEEHQDYSTKYPTSGYCQIVINPKVNKFLQTFPELLKN